MKMRHFLMARLLAGSPATQGCDCNYENEKPKFTDNTQYSRVR